MYAGRDFDYTTQRSGEQYSFSFENDLDEGDNIVSATWAIENVQGQDPDPMSHLTGSPYNLLRRSSHTITGLLTGVRYLIRCEIVSESAQTKELWSYVTSTEPNPG